MKTSIGEFDPVAKTVPVTFRHKDVVHKRSVNACLDDAGKYDQAATKLRVAEVATGVEHKIESGLLT